MNKAVVQICALCWLFLLSIGISYVRYNINLTSRPIFMYGISYGLLANTFFNPILILKILPDHTCV
jgi:hypothetical protein